MEEQYQPSGFNLLPPVVKNLLIINGLLFFLTVTFQNVFGISLVDYLGLHLFGASLFYPFQLITYMFMHGDFSHLFFNMFAVWMFGAAIENYFGSKKFLIYYIFTAIGASITHYLVIYFQIYPEINLMNVFLENPTFENLDNLISNHKFLINTLELRKEYLNFKDVVNELNYDKFDTKSLIVAKNFIYLYKDSFLNTFVMVGASGALFGLLLAFGMFFPNSYIYVFFLLPIKAKHFVIIYGVAELIFGARNSASDNIAHFAHLGGMLFGYIFIKFFYKKFR